MDFKDRFLKNSLLVFLSTAIVNVANLLYQMLVVRKLSVVSYGAFNSLFSIFTVFIFPIASIATMVAKFIPHYQGHPERGKGYFFLWVILKKMLVAGVVILLIYTAAAPAISAYLNLNSVVPVYITGIMLFLAMLSTVIFGGLQGFEDFAGFSAVSVFNSVLKLCLTFILIVFGWDLLGALAGYAYAQVVTILLALFFLRGIFSKRQAHEIAMKEKYAFIVPSFLTLISISVLTNMDVVLVKHFFDPVSAGHYSVAQLIGKIALFIPSAVYVVLLPRSSAINAQGADSRPFLKKSLLYAMLVCGSFVCVYNIFPGYVLKILTGKTSGDIILLGRLFCAGMTFFSLVIILMVYQLSVSRFRYIKFLVGLTCAQVAAITVFHHSLIQVLCIIIANSAVLFAINCWLSFREVPVS